MDRSAHQHIPLSTPFQDCTFTARSRSGIVHGQLIIMLYALVRPLARVAVYVYFRKVYLSHTDRIPRDKPVILACNHPTGFLEPCILAVLLDRPLYFLVRGDFFTKKVFARLLRALHMLPVYRWKDGGYRNLKNNFSTFDACHRALDQRRTIMIFVEGNTKYEKRLRPLQKGAARIAFGALEAFPDMEDVYLVPVGVTYTQADRFRSEVMIDFGEPVRTRDFWPRYQENSGEGVNEITLELEQVMRRHLVHIQHPKDDSLVEYLLELDRSEHPSPLFPSVSPSGEPLERERRIAEVINELGEEVRIDLRQKTFHYFEQLDQLGIPDRALGSASAGRPVNRLFLAVGLLPAVAGYLLNFLPLRAARWLADKKVAHIEFYSPVMVASGIGIYLVYVLLLALAAGLGWGLPGLLLLVALPVLGIPTLWYLDAMNRWRTGRLLQTVEAPKLEALKSQRQVILEEMYSLVKKM